MRTENTALTVKYAAALFIFHAYKLLQNMYKYFCIQCCSIIWQVLNRSLKPCTILQCITVVVFSTDILQKRTHSFKNSSSKILKNFLRQNFWYHDIFRLAQFHKIGLVLSWMFKFILKLKITFPLSLRLDLHLFD